MGAKLGLDGNLYYLSTGTRASWGNTVNGVAVAAAPANLVAVDAVRDLTITMEKGEADVSTRGNNGWKANLGTLKDATIEINAIWDPDDAALVALFTAFLTNENIALAALDGLSNTNGTQGLWADCQVMNFNRGEPLEEGMTIDITCKPALTSVAPQWVEVG